MDEPPMGRPGRARRALGAVAKALGLGAVFALAGTGAVLIHANLPALRRFAIERVNRALEGGVRGKIAILRVGGIHLTRIDGVDVEVFDPEGRRVLLVYGARARLGTFALIRSLLRGDRTVVRIDELSIDGAEAVIEEDAYGSLGIARAFAPRAPSKGGSETDVSLANIHVGHVWVHGHLAAVPVLDADLRGFAGSFSSTPSAVGVEVDHLFVRGRGLPGMNPEGALSGRASLPADPKGEKQVSAHYDGRVGAIAVHAEGSLMGRDVVAIVDVPETAPEAMTALAPQTIHLGAPVSAHAEVRGTLPVLRPTLETRIGGAEIKASGAVTLHGDGPRELAATAHLSVKNLDSSLLRRGAPRSKLTATLDVSGTSHPGGDITGTFHVENQIGWVSGHVVPRASVRGEVSGRSVRGTANIRERGAPTTLRFSLDAREHGAPLNELTFDAETTIPDLTRMERIGPIGRGSARLGIQGRMDLDTRRLSVNARGEVSGLEVQGVALSRGFVTMASQGPIASPRFVAKAHGVGMRVGGYAFSSVDASASGSPEEMDVTARLVGDSQSPTAAGSAHVTAREALTVRGARVKISREEVKSTVDIASIRVSRGAVDLDGVTIDGLGEPIEARAQVSATGIQVKAKALNVDLSRVAKLLAREEDTRGHIAIDVDATVTRRGATGHVRAEVSDLSVRSIEGATARISTSIDGTRLRGEGAVSLGFLGALGRGIDGTFGVNVDASTGRTRVSAELYDSHGPLASLDASALLPIGGTGEIEEIWNAPARLLAIVEETPIEARIVMPRRSLDALPPALGEAPVSGEIELAADLRGTARAPTIAIDARGTDLLPRGAATCVRPLSIVTKVLYDGQKADVHLTSSRDGREVMAADATVTAKVAEALSGGAPSWEASGRVALTSFPLDIVGALLDKPLGGSVSGKVDALDLHRRASLDVDLDLQGLAIHRTTFPRGRVRVTMKDRSFAAAVRLDQADGFAETTTSGAFTWGSALAPALDLDAPIEIAIRAQNFRAGAAMPFVTGVFSELDGRVDTDARLHVMPRGKEGTVEGAIVIRDGVFEVPQIGERFHGLQGRVVMKPWGTLRFEEFSAEGPTGKIAAKGEAVLRGLSLERASLSLRIPRGQSIPITVEGVPIGRANGDINASAKMSEDDKRIDVDVDVPTLHVDLPRSTGHAVQPLAPDESVRIGVHRRGEFVPLLMARPDEPRAPSDRKNRVVIDLGNDVEVKRDTTVDVAITGRTVIEMGDAVGVSGQIRLLRGKLELQGRQFIIEHGTVSFVGPDAANPLVVATALWTAPDGTRVYADFSGHVASGKLALRSEPSLSQDQILALILFGSPDGSFGAESPRSLAASTGVKAAGLAGGVLAQGLNKAISGITSVDIATRIDTSDVENPRPELSVQIAKGITARLGYKLGVPAPGQNPDRTELTIDWRFVRNWSLVAVVGDQGSTSLDVVWRKRY